MKKVIILLVLIVMLSSAGCSDANDTVVHRDGNLIITNYSDREITDTTITHGGATIAASPKAMKDTQICYFTIEPADDFSYTVSFVDDNGEEHSQEFTDDFNEDSRILIAVRCVDNVWTIDRDK